MEENEPEIEEVEDMLLQMREHMLASDLIAAASTEEVQQLLANLYGLLRTIANTMADFAMVLDRIPTPEMAKGMAEQLKQLADGLYENLPVKAEEVNDD